MASSLLYLCIYYMTLQLARSLSSNHVKRLPLLTLRTVRQSSVRQSSLPLRMSQHRSSFTVSYVSDVEGNFDYWRRFVKFSSLLRGEAGTRDLELADPQAHFVYGGDICDRGPGDIRVIEDLVSLKEKYPDRVHIILGNRDINKMRLPFELDPHIGLLNPPSVYWLRGDENQFVLNPSPTSRELTTVASNRLNWILQKTMGSPLAFEYRRQELKENECPDGDDDVVKSFLDYVRPNPMGPLTRYLQYGAVAVVLGDTLFVHGAANPHNIGYVPPYGGSEARHTADVRQWVAEINAFKDAEVADYISGAQQWTAAAVAGVGVSEGGDERAYWAAGGGYAHTQPGSRLLQYGMGWLADGGLNPSVIYSWYDVDAAEPQPEKSVAEWLLAGGVAKVVVGHQPRGDAPLVLHNHGVMVVSADTSYAVNTLWPDADGSFRKTYANAPCAAVRDDALPPDDSTRGNVVSEVLVTSSGEVSIRGCLSDGSEYSFSPSGDDLVGSRTPNGWFVKAALGECDGRRYLLALLEGHSVKNRVLTAAQLRAEMAL